MQSLHVFIQQYGLLAVFLYMLLESALLLHFTPSELVLPFAAALLVRGPFSFVVFVFVATAGGTTGSIVVYLLFGRNGRRFLDRYGWYLRVSPEQLDRGDRLFDRWGESVVFFCQLVPGIRALVSIPAGIAQMDIRRFIAYTALGTGVFTSTLTYLAYTGTQAGTPVHEALTALLGLLTLDFAYMQSHIVVVVVEVILLSVCAAVIWLNRRWIRTHPDIAKTKFLRAVLVIGLVVGILFVTSALSVPAAAFTFITWLWNDPRFFVVELGFSRRIALLLTGIAVSTGSLVVYALGQRVAIESLVERFDQYW